MRAAGIDIGSNTTLLLIVEQTQAGFEVLVDEIYFTRLAENLKQDFLLSESALSRLDKAFQVIKQHLTHWQVEEVSIVATNSARQAKNKDRIFKLGEKHKLPPISIISGEREAELTFIGSFFGLGQEILKPLVIDIGGGSTELVSSKKSYSLEMGSVSLTEQFLKPQALSLSQESSLNKFISQQLESVQDFLKEDYNELIFTAGTPITLACMEKQTEDVNKIHGLCLQKSQVQKWLDHLSKLSVEERKKIPFLPEHRTDVIVAGLSLLNRILDITEKTKFFVSATGVRYGLILEKLQNSQKNSGLSN